MISEVHTRFSAPVSKRHITPNTPLCTPPQIVVPAGWARRPPSPKIVVSAGASRHDATPTKGTANSRDKDAAQRDFVSPPGEVDVNAQRAWPLLPASIFLMRVWPREWSWVLSDLIAVVVAIVARRQPTGAGFIGVRLGLTGNGIPRQPYRSVVRTQPSYGSDTGNNQEIQGVTIYEYDTVSVARDGESAKIPRRRRTALSPWSIV